MDLIDRAALLKIFEDVQKTDPMIDNGRGYADNFLNDGGEPSAEWFAVEDFVYKMPTIEAVPLDKLCEWLQENASLTHGTLISAAGWKYELTRWMEGLDAADKR